MSISHSTTEKYIGYVAIRPTNTSVNYIIKAKQVAVPFDMAEYIRKQNVLSDIESLTVADNTEYTAPYDGFIHITFSSFTDTYFSAVVRVNDVIYDDVMIVVNDGTSSRHTFKIEVKKGDRWKFNWNSGSTGTSKIIAGTARYYKLRDYAGR